MKLKTVFNPVSMIPTIDAATRLAQETYNNNEQFLMQAQQRFDEASPSSTLDNSFKSTL